MKLTSCEDCNNVHLSTRDKHPRTWMCTKFPVTAGLNAVAPKTWVGFEPYNRCTNVNMGHCPLWEQRRDGQKRMRV